MIRVLHTARISSVDSVMFGNRIREMVSFVLGKEIDRNRPRSPSSLCESVVEHRSAETEGLRCDSSWGLSIFSLSHARGKMKKDLYFFTELKIYHLSYYTYKLFPNPKNDRWEKQKMTMVIPQTKKKKLSNNFCSTFLIGLSACLGAKLTPFIPVLALIKCIVSSLHSAFCCCRSKDF